MTRLRAAVVQMTSGPDPSQNLAAAGRLIANVLASVAAYETEVRGERVRAGQEAARAAGVFQAGISPSSTSTTAVSFPDWPR